MEKFKAVIFDLDGLLVDSEPLALESFQATCTKFGLGDLTHVFMQCVGTNDVLSKSILLHSLPSNVDYEEFDEEWLNAYMILISEPILLKQGVKRVLEHLKSNRAKLKLTNANIIHYFKKVIGGDKVLKSKPDPEIFLKAASRLSVDPSECLAFEDSPNGVQSAVASGMTVVQIPDFIKPDAELLNLGHIVMDSIEEAIDYNFTAEVKS